MFLCFNCTYYRIFCNSYYLSSLSLSCRLSLTPKGQFLNDIIFLEVTSCLSGEPTGETSVFHEMWILNDVCNIFLCKPSCCYLWKESSFAKFKHHSVWCIILYSNVYLNSNTRVTLYMLWCEVSYSVCPQHVCGERMAPDPASQSLNTCTRARKCCPDTSRPLCRWARWDERRGEKSRAGQVFPTSPGTESLHLPAAGHVMDRWKRNWLSSLALHWTWLKHSVITQTITDIHLLASAGEAAGPCSGTTDEGSKGKGIAWFRKRCRGAAVSRGAAEQTASSAKLRNTCLLSLHSQSTHYTRLRETSKRSVNIHHITKPYSQTI